MKIYLSELMRNQALVNIGTAGHVAHGKSTLVRKLSGQATQRFESEKHRNITIRLGYANAYIYIDPKTNAVKAFPLTATKFETHGLEFLYHVSFVDCPGHEKYMATMISGAGIMDHVYVVVAANEPIPAPQMHDHMIALDYSMISSDRITFLLNKLDLLEKKEQALKDLQNYILEQGQSGKIIPISAAMGDNLDKVVEDIASRVHAQLEETVKKTQKPLQMNIVRSYDVNKPGTKIEHIKGAVVGGAIASGILKVDDLVEIRPGVINIVDGKRVVQPLVARVERMQSETMEVNVAVPGGLIGVNLSIFAGLSSNDKLKGQVLSHLGSGPGIYDKITGKFRLINKDVKLILGNSYTIVINGICTIQGKILDITTKSKGLLTVLMNSPVAFDITSAKMAVLVGSKLVASLLPTTCSCSLPVYYPPGTPTKFTAETIEVINDVIKYIPDKCEQPSLDNIRSIRKSQCSIHLPNITIMNRNSYINQEELELFINSFYHGGSKTELVSRILGLTEQELLNSKPRLNQEGSLVLDGRFNQTKFNQFVEKRLKPFFMCPCCLGFDTYLDKKIRICNTCNSETYISTS